jgi:two-component system, chemotaxis family, protein-glutamate methylesterase/glutaminase
MQQIRVLIVDDSAVIRRILREAFSSDPIFQINGAASNGRIALAMIDQNKPDLVTLDI